MILIIDNYDSFTYNLVQLVGMHTQDFKVIRNDERSTDDIRQMKPECILISPGPGRPENAGVCIDVIKNLGQTIPILGVCLGHQAIGHAFGASITHAPVPMHGKTSMIHHQGDRLFNKLPNPFEATRYHSLIIAPETVPSELSVTAETDDKIIMGIRHKTLPIEGIQFHPESVLTKAGPQIISNWINNSLSKS